MKEKERFEAISVLYKQAWDNFNERRKYESKISYGIYSLFALTIAGILTQLEKDTITCIFVWGVISLGAIICIIHGILLRGIFQANSIDKKIAIYFERIMQNLSGSEFPDDLLKNKFPKWHEDYSLIAQLLITICLYVALICTVCIAHQCYC